MKIIFKAPAQKMVVRIYYDPTYSERFPWVIEADGKIQSSFVDLETAKAYAPRMAYDTFKYEINKATIRYLI